MSYVPSKEQVSAQLRILIPVAATVAGAYGVSQSDVGSWSQVASTLAPVAAYLIVGIWSLLDNTREAIIRKAAQPVTRDAPAPQIVLPAQEKALADKLPNNVTSGN